jgi:hypothetical protein
MQRERERERERERGTTHHAWMGYDMLPIAGQASREKRRRHSFEEPNGNQPD